MALINHEYRGSPLRESAQNEVVVRRTEQYRSLPPEKDGDIVVVLDALQGLLAARTQGHEFYTDEKQEEHTYAENFSLSGSSDCAELRFSVTTERKRTPRGAFQENHNLWLNILYRMKGLLVITILSR